MRALIHTAWATVLLFGTKGNTRASISGTATLQSRFLVILIVKQYINENFNSDWDQFDGPVSAIGTLDSGFFGRTYYRQLIMNDFIVDNSEDL